MKPIKDKKLILFICIYSFISLFICFFFLEFWYAKREGLMDGFHIFNTSYSIVYWFLHISYLTSIFMSIWALFELLSINNEKLRPRFYLRYFVLVWSFILLIVSGLTIPINSSMQERIGVIVTLFHCDNWFRTGGMLYSVLDLFQFSSIHLFLPILIITYCIRNPYNEITNDEVKKGIAIFASYMLTWWILTGSATLLGMNGPYTIINWNKDSLTMKIWFQLIIDFIAFFIIVFSTYYILDSFEKKSSDYKWD